MGSSGPKNITQTSKVELSPEQREVFGLAVPKIKEYAASTPQIKQTSSIADFTPEELAAQNFAMGVSLPMTAQLGGQAASTQSSLLDKDFMLNPNQYLNTAADNVVRRGSQDFVEQIAPAIRQQSQAAGGQYTGGATKEGIATGLAAGRSAQAVSDAVADMYFKNYTQGLQGLQQAVAGNQDVMAQTLMPANIANLVGQTKRNMAQEKLSEETAKFYAEQDIPLLQSQQIMALLGQMPGATGIGTVSGAMPQANPLMQMGGLGLALLGGLGGGGGGGAGLLPMLALK